MVVDKLSEVNPPSGRVPGQGILAAPLLEARRRQNRGEIAKKGSVLGVLEDEVNIGQRGVRGWPRVSRLPPGATTRGVAPPGSLDHGAPLWPCFGALECSVSLIFYIFFLEFFGHFK